MLKTCVTCALDTRKSSFSHHHNVQIGLSNHPPLLFELVFDEGRRIATAASIPDISSGDCTELVQRTTGQAEGDARGGHGEAEHRPREAHDCGGDVQQRVGMPALWARIRECVAACTNLQLYLLMDEEPSPPLVRRPSLPPS